MSDRRDAEFLDDISEAIGRVSSYIKGLTYEGFLDDTKTQDAVVRNLEIIGEATKNLSEDVKYEHPSIPWRNMAAIRDRLIHHYFGVNLDIVWEIVTEELPVILEKLKD